jgi:hypothetical protein
MRSLFRFVPAMVLIASLGCHTHEIAPLNIERLSQQEMRDGHFVYVYEAVAALRPGWLVVRGTDSFRHPSQIWVYFDETRLGGVSELRNVSVNSVAWAQHYDGVTATQRWGVGHSAGVIFLSSYE